MPLPSFCRQLQSSSFIFGRIAKQFRLMDWWCPSVRPSTFWLTFAFKFWNLLCNPAIPSLWLLVNCIHAICPGGTEKSQNFDPSKPVPAGHHFSRKICFVPESLWPGKCSGKCTAFSNFWTGQIAIKTIITRSSNPSHEYWIYLTPV